MSGDNNTVYGVASFSWAEFDRLPAGLKQILNYGVFDMGTDYIVGRLNEGENPLDLAAELQSLDQSKAIEKARETYGPSHPQARAAGGARPEADRPRRGGTASSDEAQALLRLVARDDLARAGRKAR
jgi:hypothetical protein